MGTCASMPVMTRNWSSTSMVILWRLAPPTLCFLSFAALPLGGHAPVTALYRRVWPPRSGRGRRDRLNTDPDVPHSRSMWSSRGGPSLLLELHYRTQYAAGLPDQLADGTA